MSSFKKNYFGLHLGDNSIHAAVLGQENKKIKLKNFIRLDLGEKVFERGEILDDKKLLEALKKIKKILDTKEAFISPFTPALSHLLKRAGIKAGQFENEAVAAARSVLAKGDQETYMLVQVGPKRTIINVVSERTPCYIEPLPLSYPILVEAAVHSSGAEIFYHQINKHYISWHTSPSLIREGQGVGLIKKIILYGNAPKLENLKDELTLNMRTEVELANVWRNIIPSFDDEIPEIPFEESLGYAVALGLALKGFDPVVRERRGEK